MRTAIDADARLVFKWKNLVRARYLRMSRAHQLRRLHMHAKKLKMLKRHLRTTYDMSPQDYREKWGLPADYPMVAPNYAARRSEFAKQIGLGRKAAAEQPRRKRAKA